MSRHVRTEICNSPVSNDRTCWVFADGLVNTISISRLQELSHIIHTTTTQPTLLLNNLTGVIQVIDKCLTIESQNRELEELTILSTHNESGDLVSPARQVKGSCIKWLLSRALLGELRTVMQDCWWLYWQLG